MEEHVPFSLKTPLVTTNMAGNCPDISFEISNGVVLTSVETQSRTVVTGLAALLTCNYTNIASTS